MLIHLLWLDVLTLFPLAWNASNHTAKFCLPPAYREQSQSILHACMFEPHMLYNLTPFIFQRESLEGWNYEFLHLKEIRRKEGSLEGQDSQNSQWFEGAALCLTWSLSVLDTIHYLISCHHLWKLEKEGQAYDKWEKRNAWKKKPVDIHNVKYYILWFTSLKPPNIFHAHTLVSAFPNTDGILGHCLRL